LFAPGRQLKGIHVASEIFIYFSERSTLRPKPNFENDPKDFLGTEDGPWEIEGLQVKDELFISGFIEIEEFAD